MFCAATMPVAAQSDFNNNQDNLFAPVDNNNNRISPDSLGSDKEIPRGLKVWTVDERFGDRQVAEVDTMQHMYMNTTFTEGLRESTTRSAISGRRASTVSSSTDRCSRGSSSLHSPTTLYLPMWLTSILPIPIRPSRM